MERCHCREEVFLLAPFFIFRFFFLIFGSIELIVILRGLSDMLSFLFHSPLPRQPLPTPPTPPPGNISSVHRAPYIPTQAGPPLQVQADHGVRVFLDHPVLRSPCLLSASATCPQESEVRYLP